MCYIERMAEIWKDVTEYRNVVKAEYKNDGTEEVSVVLLGHTESRGFPSSPAIGWRGTVSPLDF